MSTKKAEKTKTPVTKEVKQETEPNGKEKETLNPEMSQMEGQSAPSDPNIYGAASIFKAYKNIRQIVRRTIIQRSARLSDLYQANIFFKREDG